MKRNIAKPFRFMMPVALAGCVALFSCKKQLDVEPETTLSSNQVYRNVYDADAAVIGIYGKLMGLARQYVVLNELRADLMEVTTNADANLRQISANSVSIDNPYASPRPFFSLINDCNDVLKNFNIMLKDNKFKQSEYDQRYSDIGALRSWLYLQLGIHFGKVPYVTDPLETIDAVKDQSKFPRLEFDQLLDSLINFTVSLPWKDPYLPGTSLNITVDGVSTARFFIEKNSFIGDLYLWKGNYTQAATYYRKVMESEGYFVPPGGEQFYNQFRVKWADVSGNNDLAVGYLRYREMDQNALIENNSQGWRSMFSRSQDDLWKTEWLWVLPFNSNFSPENPFIDLFSNVGGRYLVKPSQEAIDKWNNQMQTNGFPFDARGNFTYKNIGGQPVIMKYLYNYVDGNTLLPLNSLKKEGQWFLNRAAALHLHFAEAANRDGRYRLAAGLLNNGINKAFDTSSASGRDVTNVQNTLWETVPAYRFDARNGEVPHYRGDWHRNAGIRGRARLEPISIPASDSLITIENALINEDALELAYEGYRWPDLLRIARRRNDASFITSKIAEKLRKDGFAAQAAEVEGKSLDELYLPFKW